MSDGQRRTTRAFMGTRTTQRSTQKKEKYHVTGASAHDSQATEDLLDQKDEGQPLHADSAYTGEEQEGTIVKYKMVNQIHWEMVTKTSPLTEAQKKATRKIKDKGKGGARFRVYGTEHEWARA